MKRPHLDLIRWAKEELERSDVPCAGKDAENLFMHSFNMRRENIYARKDFGLDADKIALFKRYVKLRASRFPLQYIIKKAEFMGLAFALERGVFIPRPETELLVERVLEKIRPMNKKRINPTLSTYEETLRSRKGGVNILEMGTGCGNIAISLTKNATNCKIIASDVSDKALEIAAKNARAHGVKNRIKFIKSNYFDNISAIYYNYFDIIISNPPYVRRSEIEHLQPEIAYEDTAALDGRKDGLYSYRRILSDGTKFLKKGGIFAFEIGYDQAADLKHLIKKSGRFSETLFYKDYSGLKRILITKHRQKRDKIG